MSDTGYVGIVDRESGGEWRLPLDQFGTVENALLSGIEEWFRFTTLDGALIVMRTADVIAFSHVSAEAVKAVHDRTAAEHLK